MWKHKISAAVVILVMAGAVQAQHSDGKVAVGGVTLFTYRATEGGKTPKQRVDDTYDRVRDILSDTTLKASDIMAKPLPDGSMTIVVKKKLLTTIGKGEAAANHTTPKALAGMWVAHLKQVLPGLKPNPEAGRKMAKMGKPNRATSQKKLKR